MEVMIPPNNPMDNFDFTSSVYTTAPITPRFMAAASDGYGSAPQSPTRLTEVNNDEQFDDDDELFIFEEETYYSHAMIPFEWEEKPGVPKSFIHNFEFDVNGELRRNSSVSAEDLVHRGVIKSLETLQQNEISQGEEKKKKKETERGRERDSSGLSSSGSRRTRSLPPAIRGSDYQPPACTTLTPSGSGKGSKKWSFKDLFFFRSASDGRAMDRDPLKKYSGIFRKHDEGLRNSSLRSDGSGSGSKRRGRISAHELHYTVNRAVSHDMKKQTFLPYKQGILGRLAFNPTVHALANGFGVSNKNIDYQ